MKSALYVQGNKIERQLEKFDSVVHLNVLLT
jgi:hypothetical protein